MPHPDDFTFAIEQGCAIQDRMLGAVKMPEGYHLMLDRDETLFFWMQPATGREGAPRANKWGVYRAAKRDAARLQETPAHAD